MGQKLGQGPLVESRVPKLDVYEAAGERGLVHFLELKLNHQGEEVHQVLT